MTKHSKASYRRAYLKGLRTREFNRRSRAAKRGWKTRRQRYGPSGRKPKPIQGDNFPRLIEWMVTVDYNKGKRSFSADLVIIAPLDYTPTELADQARIQLTKGHDFLANWIEGTYAEISQGEPTTKTSSTELRSFHRRKK